MVSLQQSRFCKDLFCAPALGYSIVIDSGIKTCHFLYMHKGLPIRSVCRALDIIKTINRLRSPTLTEISNATSLPYPTAFRIVQTLIHEGVIEQEPFRKRYRATELVKSLSFGFQEDDRLVAAAEQPMHDYTIEHLWPITLVVRVGNRMMVKHATHQLTTQTFINYYPGYTFPLLDCASGRAFLAFCEDDERETVLNGLQGQQAAIQTMGLQMVEQGSLLGQIRDAGYATMARTQFNETPGKTSSFAVPIFSEGQLKAALTLTFFANAMQMDDAIARYFKPLKDVAQKIGNQLE